MNQKHSMIRSLNRHLTSCRALHLRSSTFQERNDPSIQSRCVDFSDAKEAFRTKSTMELMKSYLIYTLFKYDTFVDNSFTIMKAAQKLIGSGLFNKLMKATVYGQFAAGENKEEIMKVVTRLRNAGVRTVLNYSAEEDNTNDSNERMPEGFKSFYDTNAQVLLDSIKLTREINEDDKGMIAIKLTGLCPTPLLSKFNTCVLGGESVFRHLSKSSCIIEGRIDQDLFRKGMEELGVSPKTSSDLWDQMGVQCGRQLDVVTWKKQFIPRANLYKTLHSTDRWREFLPSFSDTEITEFDKALDRMNKLAQCGLDHNVKILIDAEQTYYQSAIRYLAVNHLMSKFNRGRAAIYNTHQCYLKATSPNMPIDFHMAETGGFHYGVKLVRGAYMEQERALAIEQGYESPVWDTKEETNSNYYSLLELMLNRIKNTEHDCIVVGSHNEDTILLVMDKIKELNLSKTNGRVAFGQVMGMADHLAFAISSAGYFACKYIPYGPVEEVLPNLARRANENRGMLQGPVRERRILASEIKRRMTGGT